ncbi:MAG: hypothetical protein IJ184_05895 [Alphaproteobacteria bacterium]|nr:hypothetical protein [Alphaproteobacteria bacterium]
MKKNISGFLLLIMLSLYSAGLPLREAKAVIPFEISISETAGEVSTWIQNAAQKVQQGISYINRTWFGQIVGKGLESIQKGRAMVSACLQQGSSTYKTKDGEKKCPKWVEKTVGYLNWAKKQKKDVINSKAYQAAVLSKAITEDAIMLSHMNEDREVQVERIKENAENRKVMLDQKIEMAEKALKTFEQENQDLKHGNDGDKRYYNDRHRELDSEIKQLKVDRKLVDAEMVAEIANIDSRFTSEIAVVTQRHSDNIKKLAELDKQPKNPTSTPDEIISQTQVKYTADVNTADTVSSSMRRRRNVQGDRKELVVVGINKANDYIADLNNPSNNYAANKDLSSTAEGKVDAVQPMIDNTMMQIETIQKIIDMELMALEAQVLGAIERNIDYKVDRRYNRDTSLVLDVCNYKIRKPKDKEKEKTETAASTSTENSSAPSGASGTSEVKISVSIDSSSADNTNTSDETSAVTAETPDEDAGDDIYMP